MLVARIGSPIHAGHVAPVEHHFFHQAAAHGWIRFASIVVRSASGLMISPRCADRSFTARPSASDFHFGTVPTKVPLRVLSPIPGRGDFS